MSFATRLRTDATPSLSPLPLLRVSQETNPARMAELQGKREEEMQSRFDAGHRAYVAYLDNVPAAFGWVATRTATIGELGATFHLPADERYLWNFVTLPLFRGKGVYPRLLQAIVAAESVSAQRFWIAYAPENHASGSGIAKAGFVQLAEMSFDARGLPALRALTDGGATIASRVLGIRETREVLAPCWRCVRAGRAGMTCADGACACDYQQPQSGCAA